MVWWTAAAPVAQGLPALAAARRWLRVLAVKSPAPCRIFLGRAEIPRHGDASSCLRPAGQRPNGRGALQAQQDAALLAGEVRLAGLVVPDGHRVTTPAGSVESRRYSGRDLFGEGPFPDGRNWLKSEGRLRHSGCASLIDERRNAWPLIGSQLAPGATDNSGAGEQVDQLVARHHAEQVEEPGAEREGLTAHEFAPPPRGHGPQPVTNAWAGRSSTSDDHRLPSVVQPPGAARQADRLYPGANAHLRRAQRQQRREGPRRRRQGPARVPTSCERRDQLRVIHLAAVTRLVLVEALGQSEVWRVGVGEPRTGCQRRPVARDVVYADRREIRARRRRRATAQPECALPAPTTTEPASSRRWDPRLGAPGARPSVVYRFSISDAAPHCGTGIGGSAGT